MLDVNALVVDGELSVSWRFSPDLVPPARAEAIADRFLGTFIDMIDFCLANPKDAGEDAVTPLPPARAERWPTRC